MTKKEFEETLKNNGFHPYTNSCNYWDNADYTVSLWHSVNIFRIYLKLNHDGDTIADAGIDMIDFSKEMSQKRFDNLLKKMNSIAKFYNDNLRKSIENFENDFQKVRETYRK